MRPEAGVGIAALRPVLVSPVTKSAPVAVSPVTKSAPIAVSPVTKSAAVAASPVTGSIGAAGSFRHRRNADGRKASSPTSPKVTARRTPPTGATEDR
jgi:hypothetical protein